MYIKYYMSFTAAVGGASVHANTTQDTLQHASMILQILVQYRLQICEYAGMKTYATIMQVTDSMQLNK